MKEFGRIALFGDSIPKGYTTKGGKIEKVKDNAVSLLEAKYGFHIENHSAYGLTLHKLYERGAVEEFLRESRGEKERAAIFCIGGNDSDYDWRAVARDPAGAHESKTPLDVFRKELCELIDKLQAEGVRVLLTTLPPVDSQRYFDRVISKVADGGKVLEFFKGDLTNISRHQERYNLAVIEAGVKKGCKIIDIRSAFLMQRDYLKNYSDDGIHPNEAGHRVIARSVSEFIDANIA